MNNTYDLLVVEGMGVGIVDGVYLTMVVLYISQEARCG